MNNKVQLHDWDAAEHLRDEEDIAFFIEAALEEAPDDSAFIASVLGIVASTEHLRSCTLYGNRPRNALQDAAWRRKPNHGQPQQAGQIARVPSELVPVDSNGKPIKAKSKTKPARPLRRR